MGKLLGAMENYGFADSTIITFMGDHGKMILN